jgi:hypothetical protein
MVMYDSAQILQNQLSAEQQDVIEFFGVSSAYTLIELRTLSGRIDIEAEEKNVIHVVMNKKFIIMLATMNSSV